ncbi:peptidoglycan-binding domain-containing protein [Runella sp.]|uniref:peptidoglycan-binding domain-containing protein n=1 Tax=Runella sp. TaxID=1960881 RepID=UPI003D0DD146
MIYLKKGDNLPIVAVTQLLLNRALRSEGGIVVDGTFGNKTKEFVQHFQRLRGLNPTGFIDGQTWQRLNQRHGQIIDSVDATEQIDIHGVYRDIEKEGDDIREEGGEPLVNYGMSRGARNALNRIRNTAELKNVLLLRLHGHGSPGVQVLSSGTRGGHYSDVRGLFFTKSFEIVKNVFAELRPIFSPYGSVQLMGCSVGRGEKGYRLLHGLAEVWGVPISAGMNTQFGGGGISTFVFEGPVRTIFPDGLNLRTWAARLPGANVSF